MRKCNCPKCGKELEILDFSVEAYKTAVNSIALMRHSDFTCDDCNVDIRVTTYSEDEDDDEPVYDPVQKAYDILLETPKSRESLCVAVEEAIGYLGEALAD